MHYLYKQFDKCGTLLYVGRTCDWRVRTYDHRQFSEWWRRVTRIEIESFEDITSAIKAEKLAIQSEKPVCNTIHNQKKIPHIRAPNSKNVHTPKFFLKKYRAGESVAELALRYGVTPRRISLLIRQAMREQVKATNLDCVAH